MDRLLAVIKTVSEDFDTSLFRRGMRLGEISGWDSMKGIVFTFELESSFGVDLAGVIFAEATSVDDVIGVLVSKGVSGMADDGPEMG